MQWFQVLAAIGLASGSLLLAAEEKSRSFPFKKDDADKVPSGWKVAKTGTGEGSVWKVGPRGRNTLGRRCRSRRLTIAASGWR